MEPKRQASISSLEPYVAERVEQVIAALKSQGYDPIVYEARRSEERQRWLYGVGRTHDMKRKPVTWTLKSRHLVGKAADIISKSRGWNWPEFFVALRHEARKVGLKTIPVEGCHVEWS